MQVIAVGDDRRVCVVEASGDGFRRALDRDNALFDARRPVGFDQAQAVDELAVEFPMLRLPGAWLRRTKTKLIDQILIDHGFHLLIPQRHEQAADVLGKVVHEVGVQLEHQEKPSGIAPDRLIEGMLQDQRGAQFQQVIQSGTRLNGSRRNHGSMGIGQDGGHGFPLLWDENG